MDVDVTDGASHVVLTTAHKFETVTENTNTSTMVKRRQILDDVKAGLESRKRHQLLNWLLNDEDLFDPGMVLSESRLKLNIELMSKKPHVSNRSECRRLDTNERMETFLEPQQENEPHVYFNEEEFKNEHGMTRSQSFHNCHPVLASFLF